MYKKCIIQKIVLTKSGWNLKSQIIVGFLAIGATARALNLWTLILWRFPLFCTIFCFWNYKKRGTYFAFRIQFQNFQILDIIMNAWYVGPLISLDFLVLEWQNKGIPTLAKMCTFLAIENFAIIYFFQNVSISHGHNISKFGRS